MHPLAHGVKRDVPGAAEGDPPRLRLDTETPELHLVAVRLSHRPAGVRQGPAVKHGMDLLTM